MSPLKVIGIDFFPADYTSSCNLFKAASCKCLFDKSVQILFLIAFPTPSVKEVVSHPVRVCRNSLV